MTLLALLVACGPALPDAGGADTPAEDSAPAEDTAADTAADTDSAPADLDGDGHPEGTDCDDRDPDVHPGAAEAWNEVDDDCDGRIDADGTWSGSVTLEASAVYEGERYRFVLACPFAGERALGAFSWTITCAPPADDANAQRLLGATLTVAPTTLAAAGDAWADGVEFASSNGWDSDGDGAIAWSGFDAARLDVEMGGVSLTAAGGGTLTRSDGR